MCEDDLDIPGAIKFYDKAIKANPHSYDAYNLRGIMKMSAHDDKGSMLDFSMAIEINPHFQYAYCNRGRLRYYTNDLNGALEDIDKWIEIDSEDREAYYLRGTVYQKMGNKEKAQIDFRIAKEKGYPVSDSELKQP